MGRPRINPNNETEKKNMRRSVSEVLAIALVAVLSMAGGRAIAADAPGIAVGAKAPAIELKDQNGKKQTLGTFLGQQKKVALVFYRSADW